VCWGEEPSGSRQNTQTAIIVNILLHYIPRRLAKAICRLLTHESVEANGMSVGNSRHAQGGQSPNFVLYWCDAQPLL
jgi:hypothetical protein